MKVEEIKNDIDASLKVGDKYEMVEEFLKKNHMLYDFDYHQSRFQARPDSEEKDVRNIAIYIYTDIDRQFAKAHVERVYTGL
uniref:Uncharacterized protein n=1 Tax=Candidatus Kentrum sp. LFY TaxID=2126342 RepID=A0A450WMM2_9GAMM|nr:MAG: hypothetical protein BECKLFY1418C_GA0070996_10417 [Candidatus Kentron sp. LFY]